MIVIDWERAPRDATHYANGNFWKDEGHMFFVWVAGGWMNSRENPHAYTSCQPRPQQWPAEDRIQNIGQNGGDGLHYDEQREQHEAKHDPVNNPKHYAIAPGVEAIDIIKASLTPEQFKGYMLGNFLKYRLRAGDKGDLQQDIDKSNWYRGKLTGQTSQT
jgi:hypothetical protein